jgi:hypothetical protein
MKKLLFAVLFSLPIKLLFAQTAAKSIYGEIGGPGFASLNFDMRFQKTEDGLGGRVGIGGFSISGSSVIVIPLGINYLTSKDNRNYFEVGGGVSIISASGDFTDNRGTFHSSFGHLWIGYRLQPEEGGFTFRAGICPVFGNGFFVPYYAGLSFGYKF